MKILAIETSCDETSCAIVENGTHVISNVVSSSANLFSETGGVVPEVAARKQLEYILPVIDKALNNYSFADIDAIACTVGPGLIGSLFVGVNTAKTLSLIHKKPIIPVNHLIGHLYSCFIQNYLGETVQKSTPTFPLISLVISGGHTDLVYLPSSDLSSWQYLGGTKDDAVGEAFDKSARILGLSKYLGGVKLSKTAELAKVESPSELPRPLLDSPDYLFSFSGLKTAVLKAKNTYDKSTKVMKSDDFVSSLAKEFEEAVSDVLLAKTHKAVLEYSPKSILVSGGVSANTKIREVFKQNFRDTNLFFPPLSLTGDNAAMIGAAGYYLRDLATYDLSSIEPDPSLSFDNLY